MIIQDLNLARTIITSQLKTRSNIKPATIFSILRSKQFFCFIGDYPIASEVIGVLAFQKPGDFSKEAVKIFKKSIELKKYARTNNILVRRLCAEVCAKCPGR